MKKVGRKPKMVDKVMMTPDCVSKVRYQNIAYWTSDEPNREIVLTAQKESRLTLPLFIFHILYHTTFTSLLWAR